MSPLSDRQIAELHRIVAAIDVRCDRLERLLVRYLTLLEGRERPPQPPPAPPPVH